MSNLMDGNISWGINPFENGGQDADVGMSFESSEGLGEIVLPGFCQQNTELLNKDQRASCGLPISLSRAEQQALLDRESSQRAALTALQAQQAESAAKRKKMIKYGAAIVGILTAAYFFRRWYKNRDPNVPIMSLDGLKSMVGIKSNPPRRRRKPADLSKLFSKKKKRRSNPLKSVECTDEDGECLVLDCGRVCPEGTPYCKKHSYLNVEPQDTSEDSNEDSDEDSDESD